jgi:hypothetical protein
MIRLIADLAPCPICSAKLAIAAIPMHIERGCPPPKAVKANGGNQKADWRKVFAGAGMGKGKEYVYLAFSLSVLILQSGDEANNKAKLFTCDTGRT